MKIFRRLGIFLLLWMDTSVNGEEKLDVFLRDIIDTFRLTSPTIVYDSDEEAPEICYTDPWVLCLHPGLPSGYQEDDTKNLQSVSGNDKELANDGMQTSEFTF